MEKKPIAVLNCLAFAGSYPEPLPSDLFTFTAQIFSFSAAELIEKILKISIVAVKPVELRGQPLRHAAFR